MLEGSQEFALSLPEHNFDSSYLMVEVKSKVFAAVASRLLSIPLSKGSDEVKHISAYAKLPARKGPKVTIAAQEWRGLTFAFSRGAVAPDLKASDTD